MALIPIVPILEPNGDATGASEEENKRVRAEKRAEIEVKVKAARQ